MSRKKLILDTSVFVNPASAHVFGRTPTEAFVAFLEKAKETANVDYFMPPSIYTELMHFCEEKSVPGKLLLIINQKAPKKNELKIPGVFIYQLVESMRDRVDRGLRLAERHVREALSGEAKQKAEAADPSGKIRPDAYSIGLLRESYRRMMREGTLDSKADVDLLLLAYELDALLVSADLGVVEWAEHLGLSVLKYEQLKTFLNEHKS